MVNKTKLNILDESRVQCSAHDTPTDVHNLKVSPLKQSHTLDNRVPTTPQIRVGSSSTGEASVSEISSEYVDKISSPAQSPPSSQTSFTDAVVHALFEDDRCEVDIEVGKTIQRFWKEASEIIEDEVTETYHTQKPNHHQEAIKSLRDADGERPPTRGSRVAKLGYKFLLRWYTRYARQSLQDARQNEIVLKNSNSDLARQRELAELVHDLEVVALRDEYQTEIARLTGQCISREEDSDRKIEDLMQNLEHEKQRFEKSEEYFENFQQNTRKLADSNSRQFHEIVELRDHLEHANATITRLHVELSEAQEERHSAESVARQAQLKSIRLSEDCDSKKALTDDLLSRFQASSASNLELEDKYEKLTAEYAQFKATEGARRQAAIHNEANSKDHHIQNLLQRLEQCDEHREQLSCQNRELFDAHMELRESTPARDHHIQELEANCKAASEENVMLVLKNYKLAKSKDFEITLLKAKIEGLEEMRADQALHVQTLEQHEKSRANIMESIRHFERGKNPPTTLDDVQQKIFTESTQDNIQLIDAIKTLTSFQKRDCDELIEIKQELLCLQAEVETKEGEVEKVKKELHDRDEKIFQMGLEINDVLPKMHNNKIKEMEAETKELEDRLKRSQREIAYLKADLSAPESVVAVRQYGRSIDGLENELNNLKEDFSRLHASYNAQAEALADAKGAFMIAEDARKDDEANRKREDENADYLRGCNMSPDVHILVEHAKDEQKKREIAEKALADLQSRVQKGQITPQNQNAQNAEVVQKDKHPHQEQKVEQLQNAEQHQNAEAEHSDVQEAGQPEDVAGGGLSEASGSNDVENTDDSQTTTSDDDDTERGRHPPQVLTSEQALDGDGIQEDQSSHEEDSVQYEVSSQHGDPAQEDTSSQEHQGGISFPLFRTETTVDPCVTTIPAPPDLDNVDIHVHLAQVPQAPILPPDFVPPPGLENADRPANLLAWQIISNEMISSREAPQHGSSQPQPQWRAVREPVAPPYQMENGVLPGNFTSMRAPSNYHSPRHNEVNRGTLSGVAVGDASADSDSSQGTVTQSTHQSPASQFPRPAMNVQSNRPRSQLQDLLDNSTPHVEAQPRVSRRRHIRRPRQEHRSALQTLLEDSVPDLPDEQANSTQGDNDQAHNYNFGNLRPQAAQGIDGQFYNGHIITHHPQAAQWNNRQPSNAFMAPRLQQPPLAARGRFAHLFCPP